MTKLFFTFLFLWTPLTFAGHVTGNGGDAVVCRYLGAEIVKVELLDFYEERVERKNPPKFADRKSMEQNLDVLFDRLGHFDSYTKDRLSQWRTTFLEETNFLEGVNLVDIPDSDHISVPNGCEIEQIAIQKTPKFPGEKRYTINKDLWDRMDSANQAGLVMHELIYRQVLSEKTSDQLNSTAVRFLNSVLASDRMNVFSPETYLQFLRDELYVQWTDINGYLSYLPSYEFSDDGEVLSYYGKFTISQNRVSIGGVAFRMAEGASLSFQFDPRSMIKTYRLSLASSDSFFVGFRQFFPSEIIRPKIEIDLDKTGKLIAIRGVSFYWSSPYWKKMQPVTCKQISLWKDGHMVCQDVALELGVLHYIITYYDEILFDRNNNIRWASRYRNSDFEDAISVNFYPDQTFQKISCEGSNVGFARFQNEFLQCSPGQDILFRPDGTVKRGGYRIHEVTLADNVKVQLQHGGSCTIGRRTEVPIYESYEGTTIPKNGVVYFSRSSKAKNPSVELQHANGSKVVVYPSDYVEFDSQGRVTSVTPKYCPSFH